MNRNSQQSTSSLKATDGSISFEVREVSGRAYVVLKEQRTGAVTLQPSMTFASQAEFDAWFAQERRRLEFPLAYNQLSRRVSKIFNPDGVE
jgi:hypothetical protein